jgi:hypothetical protein
LRSTALIATAGLLIRLLCLLLRIADCKAGEQRHPANMSVVTFMGESVSIRAVSDLRDGGRVKYSDHSLRLKVSHVLVNAMAGVPIDRLRE